MRIRLLLPTLLIFTFALVAQNGKIIKKTIFDPTEYLQTHFTKRLEQQRFTSIDYRHLANLTIHEITYESDKFEVNGYLLTPKKAGNYPCVIYNRGGNLDFGSISPRKVVHVLAKIASWGYVVVASQYRGNGGGTGAEEFGGADVADVLNLIPVLANTSNADTSRIGMYGWSRGGMMTYITLTKTSKIKAAVVGGGLSDLFMMMESRPIMEEVYEDLIPNYSSGKTAHLNHRSAIKWAEKICKSTPILLLHGTTDWRVIPEMALALSGEFIRTKQPHRLVMLEGGDHGLNEFDEEVDQMAKEWLDKYLKKGHPLPNLERHGR